MSRSIETIFHEARSRLEAERGAYLDGACGDDAALRSKVEALLKADAEAGSFLKSGGGGSGVPAGGGLDEATVEQADASRPDAMPVEEPGQVFGRYKLLQAIGEGGFGSVWMAEQREPVKRRVALKIIKLGMDTRQVIARFEAERQALAMMDHPNIAKVLDAGTTDTGRPYFVMEYIRGVPILEYCDTEKLETRARLDLFTQVCHAIQHAHQKGIIHRDIKPGNVLVTMHDGVPVPKVIDFGIAKATSAELTTKTLFTEHRQMIGTPAYMSPEQAEMSGLDIDTRSDIYSLGVLLYELLTGTTPFDGKSLMEAGFAEMMRIIREEEPHKPSTRLSSLGETGTRTAQQRHVADTEKLSTLLRGDLDWIVMKCLEKDRTRRYETANGLAADIARHLGDEPVLAGPPSAKYRLAKFVKRNRGQVIAGVVVAAALVLAVVGTSTGMAWALQEKDRADTEATNASLAAEAETEARLDAEANERKAVEEAERAERELARATEIKRLITEMLQSVDPEVAQTADKTLLLGILDDAAQRLKAGEITDELIAAELHAVVGSVYLSLGLYEQAELHLPVAVEVRTRVLGKEHPITLKSMFEVIMLFDAQGRYAEAEPLHVETLEIRRRVLGEEHPDTLRSMNGMAVLRLRQGRLTEAEPLYIETLEARKRVLGAEHPHSLDSLSNLAILYTRQGRYAQSEALHLEVLELRKRVSGEEHPDTITAMHSLAWLYRQQGRYGEAEPLYLETLEIRKRVSGEEHPDTLHVMNDLATLYEAQARSAEAAALYIETLEARKRVLGEEHPDTLTSLQNLARLYRQQGRYAEYEALHLEVLELRKRVSGEEHPDTLGSMGNLAILYTMQGRYAEAEPLYLETLAIHRRVLGEEHPDTLTSMENLAIVYRSQGRYAEAEPLLIETLEARKRVLGEEHPDTLGTITNLGGLYLVMGRYAEAEPLYLETLETYRRVLGEEHPDTLTSMGNLAILYRRQGRYAEAEPLYLETLEIRRRLLGEEHPDTLGTITNLGGLYLVMGRHEDAAAMYEQSLPIKRRVLGMQHPWTGYAMRGLARAYDHLGRHDEALPLWRELLELQVAGAASPDADANTLNGAAWTLLTHDLERLRDPERALGYAERACALEEAADGASLWMYLDTLALAQHLAGDTASAVHTQQRAIALMPDQNADPEMADRLARYEAALSERAESAEENR